MYNSKSKTPISYYGGKQALLHEIMPLIPPHRVYTEVFFGGGAVFFAKEKAKVETINDKWDIAINFYQQVKTNFRELKGLIEATLISRTLHRYAQDVLKRHETEKPVLVAWAFWMCANFSFANKVLYGGIKYSNYQNANVTEQLKNRKLAFTDWLVTRLEDAYIECNDALTVLNSRNVEGAFHYLDPPYFNADMGHYSSALKQHYTAKDFEQLLEACKGLKGRFLLSNYNSAILDFYVQENGWYKKDIRRKQTVNSKGEITGRVKTEVLVLNYSPTCLIPNSLFK